MPLAKPSKEDIQKIHAEVNQQGNQRFLLTTLAVSVFGATIAWLLPDSPLCPGTPVGVFRVYGAVLLLVLLSLLYGLSHLLRAQLLVHTSYLLVTEASNWEKDWFDYRKKPYWGHTKPETVVFMVLGGFASAFPFFLWKAYSLAFQPAGGLVAVAVLGTVYEILVGFLGFYDLRSAETRARKRWEELNGIPGTPH